MPGFKKKSYTVTKSDQLRRRRAEQITRKAHAAQRRASSYLSEDEQLMSWKLHLNKLGLELRDIPADGNCLFRALADQLDGNSGNHLRYRAQVCSYMASRHEDFAPFLDDSDVCFDTYLSDLRKPGTFAGNDALVAFARLKEVTIVVHQLDSASFSIDGCEGNSRTCAELHLTYHHGEHYSSVRRIGDRSASPARIRFSRTQTNSSSDEAITVDQIAQSTGCEDKEFITQSLKQCDGDMDATVDYINSMSLAEADSRSCSSTNSCLYHSEPIKQNGSTSTLDSGICTCDSRSSQSNSITSVKKDSPKPAPIKSTQPPIKLTKSERKKEKKKRAEERRKSKKDINQSHTSPEVYEVVSQVALLSV